MRHFDTASDSLETIKAALTARDDARNVEIEATVRAILEDVKARGDAAVLDYTRRFDWQKATIEGLLLSAHSFLRSVGRKFLRKSGTCSALL